MTKLSDAELKQRQQAAVKHGAYSKKITPERAMQLTELEERLSTRPGLVEIQREQTAKSVEMCNAIIGYVVKEYKDGKPLESIPALNRIPAFMNTATRSLKQLYEMMPDEQKALTVNEILKDIQEGNITPDESSGDR